MIAERIEWPHGITILRERVAELRPLFVPPDPVQRTSYAPGELVQFDLWQPDDLIPVGLDQLDKLWVVTAVSGYSRFMAAWMVRSRAAHDVLWGMLRCFEQLDGIATLDRLGRRGLHRPVAPWQGGLHRGVPGLQRHPRRRGTALQAERPRGKGVNERANGYYETSFLPGRRFGSHEDFNDQLGDWLKRANRRVHATTREVPAEMLVEDRGAMLKFPPVLPDPSFRYSTRLSRDHYVRFDTNDYSVNPRYVGRRIEVRADLEAVVVSCDGQEVARHSRCYASAREPPRSPPMPARCARCGRERAPVPAIETEVEERDLSDYDRALGVA